MQNTVLIISILAAVFAVLTIVAYLRGNTLLKCVFKPATMLCIIAIAYLQPGAEPEFYKTAILIGLGLSLIGDVFLIFDKQLFLPGLLAFLLAHFAYVAAFYQTPTLPNSLYSALVFVFVFAVFIRLLWFSLGAMKIPVVVYALVICAMGRFAMARWMNAGGTETLLAFAGAIVFIVSDMFLAYDRFKKPVPYKDIYVLGTYFLAQWLIAMSI